MLKILCHLTQHISIKEVVDRFLAINREGIYCSFLIQPSDIKEAPITGPISPDGRFNLIDKMERARKIVLTNDYDYLFNVEHDNLIPQNALVQLLSHHKDVVSGIYRFRPSRIKASPLMYKKFNPEIREGDLVKAELVPWGCTLFSRNVLAKIPFKASALDGTYAQDCKKLGIEQWVDFSVKVGHIDYENGMEVVWP